MPCPRSSVECSSTCRRIFQRGKCCSTSPGSCKVSSTARPDSGSSSSQTSKPDQSSGHFCSSSSSKYSGARPCGSRQVPRSGVVRKQSPHSFSVVEMPESGENTAVRNVQLALKLITGERGAAVYNSKDRLAQAECRISARSTFLAKGHKGSI